MLLSLRVIAFVMVTMTVTDSDLTGGVGRRNRGSLSIYAIFPVHILNQILDIQAWEQVSLGGNMNCYYICFGNGHRHITVGVYDHYNIRKYDSTSYVGMVPKKHGGSNGCITRYTAIR